MEPIADLSLKRAQEWLTKFCAEVDEIDHFYNTKLTELATKFIQMQAKYLIKVDNDGNKLHITVNSDSEDEDLDKLNSYKKLYVSPLDGRVISLDKKKSNLNESEESKQFESNKFKVDGRQTYLVQVFENIQQEIIHLHKKAGKVDFDLLINNTKNMGDESPLT